MSLLFFSEIDRQFYTQRSPSNEQATIQACADDLLHTHLSQFNHDDEPEFFECAECGDQITKDASIKRQGIVRCNPCFMDAQ